MSSFPSIRIEGGLLGPELLDQVIAADVPGQKPADFGLEPKRNLTDEIAAAFADSRALWGVFQNRLSHLSEADLANSMTRDSWVIPFLSLLGYELTYNQRSHEIDGQTFAISHSTASPRPSDPSRRSPRAEADGRGTKAEPSTLNPQPSTTVRPGPLNPQRSTLNDSEPRPPTCDRLSALSDIPGLSAPAPSPPPDRTQKVAGNLLNRKEARPRTVKTLTAFIKAQLNNQATDVAVGEVLAQLKQGGMLTLPDGKVTYPPATI
jgi:hypothetical protein